MLSLVRFPRSFCFVSFTVPDSASAPRRVYLIYVALVLATLGIYWNVGQFDFVNYDDWSYVSQNPMVTQGLSWHSFLWGLTTSWFDFWHPMTWWSHMLDVEIFGLHPGFHHFVNLAFHIANTLILFALLRQITGAVWRSAVVAALFALHPSHVESVAWIAERKDVLSTFFALLSVKFYCAYVRELCLRPLAGKTRDYWLALAFFALGLMAKASVVTWPFVLLLLDFWPLNRLKFGTLRSLLLEKVPFFCLTTVSCCVTYLGMGSQANIMSAEKVSWVYRFTNVPVSYVRYLGKLLWPRDFAVLYPIREQWNFWWVAGSVVVVLAVCFLVLLNARRAGYLAFGWFLFLGTLVPMIGIVAMGHQSIADRYTYIPSMGIFIAMVWGGYDFLKRWRLPMSVFFVLPGLLLLATGFLCRRQVQHWSSSETLWEHCLSVDSENAIAHYNLGHVLHHSGRAEQAVPHYLETIRLMPEHVDAPLNLGAIQFAAHDYVAATNYFHRALAIKPGYAKANLNLGMALNEMKDYASASNYLALAVVADPNNLQIRCIYALSLVELGQAPAAMEQAAMALKLDPNNGIAFALLARAHALRGEHVEAQQYFAQAVRLAPDYGDAHFWSGIEALKAGDIEGALLALENAVRLKPDSAEAKFYLAVVYGKRGRVTEAIEQNRAALQLSPDWPAALNNLAWLLATTPVAEQRNGPEAVTLARRACELTEYHQAQFIGTLAAALAEAGQFDEAVTTAERAARLARETGQTSLAETNEKLRALFQSHQPFREGP